MKVKRYLYELVPIFKSRILGKEHVIASDVNMPWVN
jgi:hypothetical protein